jgi:hypothetical protein
MIALDASTPVLRHFAAHDRLVRRNLPEQAWIRWPTESILARTNDA